METAANIAYWRKARGEMMLPGERQLLYDLARYVANRFASPVIVNIGVSWGASLHCLRAGAPDAELIGIDIDYEKKPMVGVEYLGSVEFVEADSSQYQFEGPAHLVFIDGGHDYETVNGDIANWTPHIPTNGIIAFHDYAPRNRDSKRLAGIRQAVDEWRLNRWWGRCGSANSIIALRRIK